MYCVLYLRKGAKLTHFSCRRYFSPFAEAFPFGDEEFRKHAHNSHHWS